MSQQQLGGVTAVKGDVALDRLNLITFNFRSIETQKVNHNTIVHSLPITRSHINLCLSTQTKKFITVILFVGMNHCTYQKLVYIKMQKCLIDYLNKALIKRERPERNLDVASIRVYIILISRPFLALLVAVEALQVIVTFTFFTAMTLILVVIH